MTTFTFRDALSVLSKSSPFSVKTLSARAPDEYDALKNWLYIQQDIEKDLRARLAQAGPGDILFLCGSSGDGKSEILTRVHQEYIEKVRFHLDATHSFQPHQSAIEALDEVFYEARRDNAVLVVGINIGMIGNYVQEGHADHDEIKSAMRAFLEEGTSASPYAFFNFEDYPKFRFDDGLAPNAPFAKQLMQRLTAAEAGNPFYTAFARADLRSSEPLLFANYRLLMLDGVQDAIIANLTKARLVKDQFVTARSLLDLLYHLLAGPGYLFDNLFSGGDNELIERLAEFDPALLRTRELDQLVLRYELDLPETDRTDFIAGLAALHIAFDSELRPPAASFIRLLYVLQAESIANDYHQRYAAEFSDAMLADYALVWTMHARFTGTNEEKTTLRKFYVNTLTSGIFRYANRNAPELGRGEILLGEYNGIKVAGLADLRPDFAALQHKRSEKNIAHFQVALRVGEIALEPIPFNINLFNLLVRLNQGYRPNKYDKNAVVLLDELVEHIKSLVKRSDRLKLYRHQKPLSLRYDDGAIETVGDM